MTSPITNYFDDGMEFFESAEYEQAIEMFTKALRLSLGDLAEIHLYRGICYGYLQAYDRAMNDFNNALRKNPYLADAYNERGTLYRFDGEYQLAIDDYLAVITIDPKHYPAYYNRALAYEKTKKFVEADEDLTQAIALDSGIPACYEARGRVRIELKNFKGALEDYQRFLRMGGGREYDNQSDVQSLIIALRINNFLSRIIPARFLPSVRL